MIVLGIESTCDETACALVKDGQEILSNVISSQIDLHRHYGGVVPELACRRHVDVLLPVLDKALKDASLSLSEVDLIAVAHGPGLVGALLLGVQAAKALAFALDKPFIGVNHVEAHLYAAWMSAKQRPPLPALGLVVSGGHSSLLHIDAIGSYRLIGQTADDAIGEAFDKAAKLLNLSYPGGPEIEKLAKEGDSQRFHLKAGKIKGRPYDFSFSGLKTALLYTYQEIMRSQGNCDQQTRRDLAASFQKAAFDSVIDRLKLAVAEFGYQTILFGGGVTNNQTLRQRIRNELPKVQTLWPELGLSLDNAAMIAGLGYERFKIQGQSDPYTLDALTRIPLGEPIQRL